MDAIIPIAIYLVLGLIGLGLLVIALFGVRSMAYGKISPVSAGAVLLPIVLLGILGLVIGDWALAAIVGLLITLGITILAMLLSGVRGIFS